MQTADRAENNTRVLLYHTGFAEIRKPDIHFGRVHADFGQGFYLSPDPEFSRRWAKDRPGVDTFINVYELNPDALKIKRFERDEAWFDYIFHNRNGYPDSLTGFDVITGPIANDTLYDTWGILTSGMLSRAQALSLLTIGPQYEQTVIKTEKALSALHWLSSEIIDRERIKESRTLVREEEKVFQEIFKKRLGEAISLVE